MTNVLEIKTAVCKWDAMNKVLGANKQLCLFCSKIMGLVLRTEFCRLNANTL